MKSDQSLHCLFHLMIDLAWPSSTAMEAKKRGGKGEERGKLSFFFLVQCEPETLLIVVIITSMLDSDISVRKK